MVSEEEKRELEEINKRKGILEALLVSSMIEDNFMFPREKEFILSEVVNGTIDYIGGNPSLVNYRKLNTFNRNLFEKNLWGYFEKQTHSSKKILNSKIKNDIIAMIKPYPSNPVNDLIELYHHFKNPFGDGISNNTTGRIFSLPYSIVYHVQKYVLPSLSDSEKKDVVGIGKSMRKYIDEDLKHIRTKCC